MGDRNLEPAKYSAFICEGSRRIFLWEDSHFVTHITSLKSPLVVLTSWERNIHIGLQSLLQNPWANCVFPPVTYYFARILELQKNASLIGSIPHLLSLIFVLQFWYSLTSLLSILPPKSMAHLPKLIHDHDHCPIMWTAGFVSIWPASH